MAGRMTVLDTCIKASALAVSRASCSPASVVRVSSRVSYATRRVVSSSTAVMVATFRLDHHHDPRGIGVLSVAAVADGSVQSRRRRVREQSLLHDLHSVYW